MTDEEKKEVNNDIPTLWKTIGGPNKEFVLGMAYERMLRDADRLSDLDKEKSAMRKRQAYIDENCMILR